MIGCDHGALVLKNVIVAFLKSRQIEVNDVGTHTVDAVDYPDIDLRIIAGQPGYAHKDGTPYPQEPRKSGG